MSGHPARARQARSRARRRVGRLQEAAGADGHQVQEAIPDQEGAGDSVFHEDLEAARQGCQIDSTVHKGIHCVSKKTNSAHFHIC